MLIQQAIFTSCQTSHSSGYQLVATSPGIAEVDTRELTLWGPSHDSLWESGPAAVSVNFHRLPSGAYCVSQTTPAGAEYSQRRGPQVYTQSLLVDAEALAEFGNNPFSLLQNCIALGLVCVHDKIPKRLEPFWIDPEPRPSCEDALDQLVRHPGPQQLGRLLDLALHCSSLGIVAGERGACLVSALIQCLPRQLRPEFSFTTGLRFSPRRPFRVICLPSHMADNARLARQHQMTLFDTKSPPESASLSGWASFVTEAIAAGRTELLAAELDSPCEAEALEALDQLGRQRLELLHPDMPNVAMGTVETVPGWQRADGAHRSVPLLAAHLAADSSDAPLLVEEPGLKINVEPAIAIGRHCPQAVENLQQLEDAIFDCMAGKDNSGALAALWPLVLAQVGPARVEQTREHFLRYALAVWRQLNAADTNLDPCRGLQAMQVVSLLFGQ